MKRVFVLGTLLLVILLVMGCGGGDRSIVTPDSGTKQTIATENDEVKAVVTDNLPVLAAAAATKAAEEAEGATQKADEATQEADEATQEADEATQEADEGTQEADEAVEEAEEATEEAEEASQEADEATEEAEEVTQWAEVATEEADEGNSEAESASAVWDRAPDTIILQLREGGGFRLAPLATQLPQWTLYGDGVVIWTEKSAKATAGFTEAVWMGTLSDPEIEELLAFADEIGFWSLEPSYSINDPGEQVETDDGVVMTQPQIMDLPSGTLSLNVADRQHSVLMYPPDYERMPEAYQALRERMLATHPSDGTAHTASTFRLEARSLGAFDSLPEGTRKQLVEWHVADIALADVAQAPQTLAGSQGVEVGDFLIAQGNYILQDGVGYEVKLFAEAPRPITQ